MTTTDTGRGLAIADSDAPLLELRPRQTRMQKLASFARSKPLGAVSAVIILLTILAAAVSYTVPAVLPHDPLDVRAHERNICRPSPARDSGATTWDATSSAELSPARKFPSTSACSAWASA